VAAQLADDHLQAKKLNPFTNKEKKGKLKRREHKPRNCPEGGEAATSSTPKNGWPRRDLKDVTCYNIMLLTP